VQQVQTVVKHIRCPGDCNIMMRIALSWAQLSTGMGFHVWNVNGLNRSGQDWIRLAGALNAQNHSCADGDVYIMDAVCDCKQFTNPQIRQINACRLYIQVILISDVVTPNGRTMMVNYYNGKKFNRKNWPTMRYPRQEQPPPVAWRLWRRAFNLLYLQQDKKTLQRPLGSWHEHHRTHHQWATYVADD
jgi:hypothetical protein